MLLAIPWGQIFGYIGGLFFIGTSSMKTMVPLRAMSIAGSLCFIAWGWWEALWPTVFLHVVLVPDSRGRRLHQIGGQLPVGRRHGDQLAAGDPLRRTAFVHGDVGPLGADHRLAGAQQRLQPHHVGPGPVEDEQHLGVVAEALLDQSDGPFGHGGGPVGGGVVDVGGGDGLEHGGVDARPVVAGEVVAVGHHPRTSGL